MRNILNEIAYSITLVVAALAILAVACLLHDGIHVIYLA